MLGGGEGVEEHHRDGRHGQHRGSTTGCQPDAVQHVWGPRGCLCHISEGADDGRAHRATDALTTLADEGEDRVAAALGADVGLPLAVVDGVGPHGEHHRVGAAGAGAEEEPGDHGNGEAAAGHQADHHKAQHGHHAQRDIGLALAEGHRCSLPLVAVTAWPRGGRQPSAQEAWGCCGGPSASIVRSTGERPEQSPAPMP